MKVVKLTIDEESEFEGIDAVALVEEPAIEVDFQAFSEQKFESYNDYPQAARKAAEQGIKRNEELGNKCGTLVGKQRAQQLAQGKNITIDTIKRMRAFLIRQKDNYDLAVRRKDYNACGYISYLLWGGPAALPWAEKKLRQAGILDKQNEEIIRDYFNEHESISEYFAEIGPRGGIKPSKKAPRSTTPGEGKSGSKRNKPGAAAGERGGVKVPASVEKSLQKKSDDFNEKYKDKLGYGVSLPKLKTVYQRGVGAYQTSHSPNVKSAEQWAQARVNAFLYLVKNGRPQNKKYTADFDLLPAGHPKSTKKMSSQDVKFFDDMDAETQELLLKALGKRGLSNDTLAEEGWEEINVEEFHKFLAFAITSDPDKGSLQDTNNYRVLYKYEGPRDSKNRDFCRELLQKDLLYRLEDINNMSLEGANKEFSTYDIFAYKGSYNCRHAWVQKFYRKNVPVDEQKRSTTTNKGPKEVIGGPRAQEAAQRNPKSRTLQQILEGVPPAEWTFSKQDGDKMLLAGPLMIADKLIPRIDDEGNKYYVFFDEEAIQKLSYKLMKNKLIDSINIEHDPQRKVDDISLVETWLVEDPKRDKSNSYGYELNKGSWFGVYKVNNKDVWDNYIKTGKVKGFSVEGLFNDKVIMQNAIT